MDDDAWRRLREAAQKLEASSRQMADAGVIRAGGPNLVDGEVPEGAASRAEIQAMIDADPDGFRAEARDLAERARLLVDATRARDVAAAGHRAAEIDAPCQSCHTRYWYKQDPQAPEEGRPSA
jgi:cytochrome c556